MLLKDRANLLSKIRGEKHTLRIWMFFSLFSDLWGDGGMWRRPGSEDTQQKAAKRPGFAEEVLQVEKWQNQN